MQKKKNLHARDQFGPESSPDPKHYVAVTSSLTKTNDIKYFFPTIKTVARGKYLQANNCIESSELEKSSHCDLIRAILLSILRFVRNKTKKTDKPTIRFDWFPHPIAQYFVYSIEHRKPVNNIRTDRLVLKFEG